MRRSIPVIVLGLFVGIWIGSCTRTPQTGADQSLSALETRIDGLSKRLNTQNKNLRLDIDELAQSIRACDSRIGNALDGVDENSSDIRRLQTGITDMQFNISTLRTDVDRLQRSK